MSALEAARMGDEIGHTSAWAGLIAGACIGLAIGGAILFTAVTGGAGAILIGAAIAGGVGLGAAGALAGAEIGKMFEGSPCGAIETGSPDTFIEARAAARAELDVIEHGDKKVAQGSSTVLVNGKLLGRKSERAECGGVIRKGASFTFIGGDTLTRVPIEDEVPSWLITTLQWTALIGGGVALVLTGVGVGLLASASAGVLAGVRAGITVTALGLGGSLGGGFIGKHVGGAVGSLGGERAARIGEIVGEFGGSLYGGVRAVKLGEQLGALRLPAATPATPGRRATPSPQEVARARTWTNERMAEAPPPDPAANARLDARIAENRAAYERVQRGELEHPNTTPERLKMAVEGAGDGQRVPLTYKDRAQFDRLQGEIKNTFESEGITDATVQQLGSATDGFKGNPEKPFGFWSSKSDTDFAIHSDQALVQAQQAGAPYNTRYGIFKNGEAPSALNPEGRPGLANTSLGSKLNALAERWNVEIYGEPNPSNGGFDFKLNGAQEPNGSFPTIYRGPEAYGTTPPAPRAPAGSAGTAGAGGTSVATPPGDGDP
ncbi:PAAR domain-containing protein [Sorangium sp. So ce1014]|uniref:PAAR domain-containing protein n=1 Tax=Sorangium sp. So ce1014 TaxID=3133326 RepID=UPI003F61ECC4